VFDSMHMHMPVMLVVLVVAAIVVMTALFVVMRVVGQRAVDSDSSQPGSQPPSSKT